ncbi:Purine catabolism protein PucB [Paenibacillus sp. CECT 9249]|uniref:NTP transferase domain-containing protein n=1 Tax=Paenibacillus sp. CECT 9249 TaxID=2845385 RepID=UPI001E4A7B6A|nr:NTP transferase domain-containing protein [Paenibacillus sp. CECT 9249]CAH0121126.1 Purine catabolism protein PucB [Paenibacillus sp. CECT 9249]
MIWGIYLAAGQSRRMGRPKLCLPLGGKPLGSIALEAAAASLLNGIALVTQPDDSMEWISARMSDSSSRRNWVHVPCEAARLGMAESLKCGVRAVQRLQARAVLVLLADQPFVTAPMIDHIVTLYKKNNKPFIAASWEGIPRPPVLFDSRMFPHLLRLQGDDGARRMIRTNRDGEGMTVEWHDAKCFIDIDTQSDYEMIRCKTEKN